MPRSLSARTFIPLVGPPVQNKEACESHRLGAAIAVCSEALEGVRLASSGSAGDRGGIPQAENY